MLDDLWTRFAVKSRWMDETAGGCTNFISWRHNNQWLLHIRRPATKLIIKLTQPDARKTAGNGRHYSNALGFYIFKGNAQRAPTSTGVSSCSRRATRRRAATSSSRASRASRASRRSRTPSNPNPEP